MVSKITIEVGEGISNIDAVNAVYIALFDNAWETDKSGLFYVRNAIDQKLELIGVKDLNPYSNSHDRQFRVSTKDDFEDQQ